MALVFRHSAEEPARCALEIAEALRKHPEIPVRMGIHSGPVSEVTDVSGRSNLAGAGINMAQRVMDCGDAGHILLSQHVADDLVQYRQWAPRLRDLGECEVKHGVRLRLVNLYAEPLGNPDPPEKFRQMAATAPTSSPLVQPKRMPWHEVVVIVVAVLLALLIGAGVFIFRHRTTRQTSNAPTSTAAPTVADKSIAVLPFENLSRDPDNAFFTDGVQDQILTALAKVADLKVISRTSVMQYKSDQPRNTREIAQQLGVAHLLEGSVQRAGNKVRVNAQLIDARSDAHEWAENYDRPIDDVFAIQSEIAKAIADQLQARLSPNEKKAIEQPPTNDVTAFDLYSRARNLILTTSFSALAGPSLRQAVDLLNQALARDPSFLVAQCQLAYAHDNFYFLGVDHTAARLALADAAVAAAFRLAPDAGESHLARAEHLYRGYRDYDGALAELEIARRTLPNDARIFRINRLHRAPPRADGGRLAQSPEGGGTGSAELVYPPEIALSYLSMRRYADEAAVLDRALAIKPDDPETKVVRALVPLDWKADTRPLQQMLAELRAKDPEAMKNVADTWLLLALAERDAAAAENAVLALGDNVLGNDAVQFRRDFAEGLIARMTGDEAKARPAFTAARADQEKRLQTQPDYGPALCVLAVIDAGLGRKEDALREGRRAIELLPYEKDSINGAHMVEYFALTAAWVGEKDLACEQLAKAVQLGGSSITTYGQLKLTPYWDPLRGYPRFEKIVESLAPKDAK